jgi:predicted nucleic-acid-binding protein
VLDNAPPDPVIDERWLVEWAAFGIDLLAEYLAKHAAFADYLQDHGLSDPR